jgi:hypothetical protein
MVLPLGLASQLGFHLPDFLELLLLGHETRRAVELALRIFVRARHAYRLRRSPASIDCFGLAWTHS